MKTFVKIIAWAFVVFVGLAMIEESEAFLPLLGIEVAAPAAPVDETGREEVVTAVRGFLTLMGHLYGSGGDRRYVERMAASPEVINELLDEVRYVQHNRRTQEMTLQRLNVVDVAIHQQQARVRTKEYWIIRTGWSHPGLGAADPTRSTVIHVDYLLQREGERWLVIAWDLANAPDETASPPSGP